MQTLSQIIAENLAWFKEKPRQHGVLVQDDDPTYAGFYLFWSGDGVVLQNIDEMIAPAIFPDLPRFRIVDRFTHAKDKDA